MADRIPFDEADLHHAIYEAEGAYQEAFDWDKFGWGPTWIASVAGFKGELTVENLRAARKWGKERGWHWGPGTFRGWLVDKDEAEHERAQQVERVAAATNPLAQKIAEAQVVPDVELERAWDALSKAEQRRIVAEHAKAIGSSIKCPPAAKAWWRKQCSKS